MTDNEAQILAALAPAPGHVAIWRAVRDFGGLAGSHHGTTAARMCDKGWLHRMRRADTEQGRAYSYRITDNGIQALANHRLLKPGTRPPAQVHPVVYLRDVGTNSAIDGQYDECWVVCAKGDPGAVPFSPTPETDNAR